MFGIDHVVISFDLESPAGSIATLSMLVSGDTGDAYLGHEIRIFTEGFDNPSPPRIGTEIHDRRVRHVKPATAALFCDGCEYPLGQIAIKGCGEREGLREHRRVVREKAPQGLTVNENGYAKSGLFTCSLLNAVQPPCGFPCGHSGTQKHIT